MKEQEEIAASQTASVEAIQETYTEVNEKLAQIDAMIADLQRQSEQARQERKAYEAQHGITDGDERVKAAMEAAKKNNQLRQELDKAAAAKQESSDSGQEEAGVESNETDTKTSEAVVVDEL